MAPEYVLERSLVSGSYNLENPDRLDEEDQIHCAKEVSDAFPGEIFKMRCDGTVVNFDFDQVLDAGQQTLLANTVDAHKNNT